MTGVHLEQQTAQDLDEAGQSSPRRAQAAEHCVGLVETSEPPLDLVQMGEQVQMVDDDRTQVRLDAYRGGVTTWISAATYRTPRYTST